MKNNNKQTTLSKEQIDAVMTLYSSGKINEAIVAIKTLNEEFHNVPLLFNILGACYQSLKQFDASIQMFETALSLKPDYAEAHFNLGVILRVSGRPNLAVESYKKAIALLPNYLGAHNNLGNALKQIGRLEEAVISYQNAIAIKPDYAEAHNNIGIVLKDLGRLSESVKSYEAAILINPEFYDAHFNLGNSLRDLNQRDQALKSYEAAHELKPDEDYIIGNILHTKMHLSIWEGLSKNLLDLIANNSITLEVIDRNTVKENKVSNEYIQRVYNTEKGPNGIKWLKNADLAEKRLDPNSSEYNPIFTDNWNNLTEIVTDIGKDVFSNELLSLQQKHGIYSKHILLALKPVYSAETTFGTNNEISSGGAVGELQVIYPTFQSLVKNNYL